MPAYNGAGFPRLAGRKGVNTDMGIHFEPLRPNRAAGIRDKYEFTHGTDSVCVYDIQTLRFITEIPVGKKPDCHATSPDNRFLYIACLDGLYCIGQDSLEVERVIDTGPVYATNAMPDGDVLLVHDLCGGVIIIRDIMDMNKVHIHKKIPVIPGAVYRSELGGKGHFLEDWRYYLCAGWKSSQLYMFDMQSDFAFEVFMPEHQDLMKSDDLIISSDKTKAYTACHSYKAPSYVAVIDIPSRSVTGKVQTGNGTCGLAMSNDERCVIASNDADDSISVIDTFSDTVVNTLSARKGFESLGITGYIQGISTGTDDSVYVYGCSGNGAIVRFNDITGKGGYVISYREGLYKS